MSVWRADGHRSIVAPRTPSDPVSRASTSATCALSAVSASADTVWAGRPFFITIGVIQASWAPASRSALSVWASVSPVASSTFTSSTTTGCPPSTASLGSPITTCVAFG